MKKLLTCLLVAFFYLNADAQNTSKSSFDIMLGASLPTGDFAKKDVFDDESGLAKIGTFVDLSYRYQATKVLGITATLKGSIYGVDASNFTLPSGTGASSQISTTNWNTGAILGGIYQLIPLSADEKWNLEFRELVGVQFSRSPEMIINVTIPNIGTMNSRQEPANATAFAFAVGTGLRYQLHRDLGFKLFADYNSSNSKFDVTVTSGGTTTQQPTSQKITTVNVGVGLTVGF